MSERIQRTAATMRNTMSHRYDDGLHHKHNKCRLPYRLHWPSHQNTTVQLTNESDQTKESNDLSNLVRKNNIKKTRLRIVKHRIH